MDFLEPVNCKVKVKVSEKREKHLEIVVGTLGMVLKGLKKHRGKWRFEEELKSFRLRKVGDHSRGRPEGFLFNSYYPEV